MVQWLTEEWEERMGNAMTTKFRQLSENGFRLPSLQKIEILPKEPWDLAVRRSRGSVVDIFVLPHEGAMRDNSKRAVVARGSTRQPPTPPSHILR
jgi:hypothetical protein